MVKRGLSTFAVLLAAAFMVAFSCASASAAYIPVLLDGTYEGDATLIVTNRSSQDVVLSKAESTGQWVTKPQGVLLVGQQTIAKLVDVDGLNPFNLTVRYTGRNNSGSAVIMKYGSPQINGTRLFGDSKGLLMIRTVSKRTYDGLLLKATITDFD